MKERVGSVGEGSIICVGIASKERCEDGNGFV